MLKHILKFQVSKIITGFKFLQKRIELFLNLQVKFLSHVLVLTQYLFLNTFCPSVPTVALQRKVGRGKRTENIFKWKFGKSGRTGFFCFVTHRKW